MAMLTIHVAGERLQISSPEKTVQDFKNLIAKAIKEKSGLSFIHAGTDYVFGPKAITSAMFIIKE